MSYRLHKEGNPYLVSAIFFFIASLIFASFFTSLLTVLLFLLSAFFLILFLIFFRNPPRVDLIKESDAILSPADGKVVVIEKTFEKEFLNSGCIQISIFMSPLNVHINRSPVEGEVIYQEYHSGSYLVAWHPKSSELNERNTIVIRHNDKSILLRQIAGKVARKIVSYAKTGDQLKRGQEFGFIKFGSRVDVFIPTDSIIKVKIGDVVQGGVSELAKFSS
ncbi:MAG TPA: phosphatidylserine decarboxylase family protein [Saprospiraceae bacterium]|nr:phosphatidylserine decarboxylase family protein [Saprospiraceae bacterium]